MITVSRAEWNARPPLSTTPLTLSKVELFVVHYSGAVRSQTVRSIQDYCMDVRGFVDIDYNAIVKDGKHYVGRGWNVGAHTKDHNSISYGVCVVGQDGDATPEDMDCVREIYDMVCARLGRQITKTDHRMVLGRDYTDCPGDELDAWVAAGMPAIGGDDVSWTDPLTAGKDVGGGGPFPAHAWLTGANAYADQARKSAAVAVAEVRAARGEITALRTVVEQLAEAILAGGGSIDTQAILAGVDARLAAQREAIEADTRDAIADAEEGGAAAVRADS